VQTVELEQVEQGNVQSMQVFEGSKYAVGGHWATHCPDESKGMRELVSQEVQLYAVGPSHVLQLDEQVMQTPLFS
jgi:hypothetical protein